jgi:hypothetical protein
MFHVHMKRFYIFGFLESSGGEKFTELTGNIHFMGYVLNFNMNVNFVTVFAKYLKFSKFSRALLTVLIIFFLFSYIHVHLAYFIIMLQN